MIIVTWRLVMVAPRRIINHCYPRLKANSYFARSPAPAPARGRLLEIANQSDFDFASKNDCASQYKCQCAVQCQFIDIYPGIHCFKRESDFALRFSAYKPLRLCRCESECSYTPEVRLTMEPAYYRNFYSSSSEQPLPEAQRRNECL